MFRLRITGDLGFEFWKDIPEYKGQYQASVYGRIKSLGRTVNRNGHDWHVPERIISIDTCRKYDKVELAGKKYLLHRIIAMTFPEICGEWFDGCQVNHKDENKKNNVAFNLETCTAKYNSNYGKQAIYHENTRNRRSKTFVLNGREFFNQLEAAKHFGVSPATISLIANGLIKQSRRVK